MAEVLKSVRRIVVKVGYSILVENQVIASHRIEELCAFLADLQSAYEVILVTSGAIAAGYTKKEMDKSLEPNKQALASMGQPLLMHMYYTEFQKHGVLCAQMLLGAREMASCKGAVADDNAIEALLTHKVVPIINEHDAISPRELLFGDNNRLSAHIAYHFKADLLVILSDIDGYYTANPRTCADAKTRLVVHEINPDDLVADATPNNRFATGGIVTKLQAAQFLLKGGKMYLSSGFRLEKARDFLGGHHHTGTLFLPPALTSS
ncbi:hypothetical protein LSCM1_06511 [Leishmania martiniquensis]|uniref:Aspartate/glutamate/uridylate kinase domain-containing protein n=1 Tax=Leishmania martiniquensis TaxID=1580590 RepID=A0A836GVV9_9TRYP|nr:hypothetical protein LSCM1_06511 [Leishmania martiniquensis]